MGVSYCVCDALKIAASNLNVINNPFSFTNNNYLSVGIRTVWEWARYSTWEICTFRIVCMCNQQVFALRTYRLRIFAQFCFHCGISGFVLQSKSVLFNDHSAFLWYGRTVSVCEILSKQKWNQFLKRYLHSKGLTKFWIQFHSNKRIVNFHVNYCWEHDLQIIHTHTHARTHVRIYNFRFNALLLTNFQ